MEKSIEKDANLCKNTNTQHTYGGSAPLELNLITTTDPIQEANDRLVKERILAMSHRELEAVASVIPDEILNVEYRKRFIDYGTNIRKLKKLIKEM